MTARVELPAYEGAEIRYPAGPVDIVLVRVRPNTDVVRLSIRNHSGFEIDGLCWSGTERTVRHAARTAALLFRHGMTVNEVLALVHTFAPATEGVTA